MIRIVLIVAVVVLFPLNAFAQAPEAQQTPKTKLEAFQAQDGVVLIQGFSWVAEMRGNFGGSLTITAKEFTNATSGSRQAGVIIDVKEGGRIERSNRSFVDYDEIDSLLKGIDYIAKVEKSVTKLDNFQADYKTKGDLRVGVFSASSGETMMAVSCGRVGATSVHMKREDLAMLRKYLSAARDRLDGSK